MNRIPVTRSSRLQLTVRTSVAVTIGLRGYSGKDDFQQKTFGEYRFTPSATDGSRQISAKFLISADRNFDAGYLYSTVAYIVNNVSVIRGECLVRLDLLQSSSDGITSRTLFSTYLTTNSALTFPGSPIESSTSGAGIIKKYFPADPGAGNNPAVIYPGGNLAVSPSNFLWQFQSLKLQFQTVGAGADRHIHLEFGNTASGRRNEAILSQLSQPTGVTTIYSFSNYGNDITSVLPTEYRRVSTGSMTKLNGLRTDYLIIFADNLIATDIFSSIALQVEEWILD